MPSGAQRRCRRGFELRHHAYRSAPGWRAAPADAAHAGVALSDPQQSRHPDRNQLAGFRFRRIPPRRFLWEKKSRRISWTQVRTSALLPPTGCGYRLRPGFAGIIWSCARRRPRHVEAATPYQRSAAPLPMLGPAPPAPDGSLRLRADLDWRVGMQARHRFERSIQVRAMRLALSLIWNRRRAPRVFTVKASTAAASRPSARCAPRTVRRSRQQSPRTYVGCARTGSRAPSGRRSPSSEDAGERRDLPASCRDECEAGRRG